MCVYLFTWLLQQAYSYVFYLYLWSYSTTLVLSLSVCLCSLSCAFYLLSHYGQKQVNLAYGAKVRFEEQMTQTQGKVTETPFICFLLFISMSTKNKNVFKWRLGHNSRAGFLMEAGRIDIWVGPDQSEKYGSPFEEWASAKSCLCLTKSPTICNKCALLKQYHMDNKLAINTASAHPLNLAQISNFQSNWLLI